MPIEAPLILIIYGALRSGTTLLRLMLDGHPGISCPGEADFLVDYISEEHKEFKIDFKELEENRIFKASGIKLRRDVSAGGVCQRSCPPIYAASLISRAPVSRSGLSQTGPPGCQLRVWRDRRSGFCARAFA